MFNVGSVQGYLKLNTTGWTSSMRSASASVNQLARTFTRMGGIAVGSLFLIEREFGKFDKAIRHATSVSETSGKQFAQMSEMALDASVKWNKAAASTAQAFYFLGSAGLTVTEQLQAFNDTIMLSRAMGSELSQTVEGMVDIVRAFGLEFANSGRIADQITKTIISSNQQFYTLSRALSYAASTARLTNNTLAETTAMLGVMANAGIKGSMAGTVLRRAMTNLMAPTGGMAELVHELGINIYDTSNKMKPFIQIMGDISDSLRGATDEYKNMVFETLFGRRAIAGQIVLFNYGSAALREYANEIQNAGGTTERVAGKQMKAFTEQLGRLWQEMKRVAIIAGGTLAPAVGRLGDSIRERLSGFREYVKLNSAVIAETLKWTAAIGTLMLVGGPLLLIITSLAGKMVALSLVIANPFVILIAALYTLRAVWKQTTEEMRKKVGEAAQVTATGYAERLIEWGAKGMGEKEGEAFRRGAYAQMGRPLPQLGIKPEEKAALTFGEIWSEMLSSVDKQMREDIGGALDFVDAKLGDTEGLIGELIRGFKEYAAGLSDLFKVFMTEPRKWGGIAIPELAGREEFERWVETQRRSISILRAELGETKDLTIWEVRWKNAIKSVAKDIITWNEAFLGAASSIRTEWATTIEDFINGSGKFKDFIEQMFLDILHSFNKMMAKIAADKLWYAIFGQAAQTRWGGVAGRGSIGAPDVFPAYDTSDLIKSVVLPELKLGRLKKAVPEVVINLTNNGEPAKMHITGQSFDGKRYIINAVMEEYNSNPNFRSALKE